MLAVLREDFEIANMLVQSKLAKSDFVNIEGLTALQIAINLNRVRVINYLGGKTPGDGKLHQRSGSEAAQVLQNMGHRNYSLPQDENK